MAARLVAKRNNNGTTMWHALYLAVEDAELRRIDQIISGIDRDEGRPNFFKVRSGIIIVRSLQRVEHIVCVIRLHNLLHEFVEDFIRFRECRRFLSSQDWIAAHEPEHLRGGAQARWVRLVVAAVPGRIVANGIDDYAAPGAVASGNLRR